MWDEPGCVLEGSIHALGTLFNIDSDFLSIQQDSCWGKQVVENKKGIAYTYINAIQK